MSDEWIALAQAFEMMLASEKDPVLIERLLSPALWHGTIPAISRRALVEGKRVKDLKLITTDEWHWDESPIIFDYAHSRAWSPAGFNRPTRESEILRFAQTEYYVVEIDREALLNFLPDLRGQLSSTERKSPGRPNVVQIFAPEIDRRILAGERYKTQVDWANALIDWYWQAYGKDAPPISVKRITNLYGRKLNQFLSIGASSNRPKPKMK